MTISEEQGKLTRTFGARSRAYDNDVIQLFWPFADFTQPIVTKNLEVLEICLHWFTLRFEKELKNCPCNYFSFGSKVDILKDLTSPFEAKSDQR